jgi:hypothetical protein
MSHELCNFLYGPDILVVASSITGVAGNTCHMRRRRASINVLQWTTRRMMRTGELPVEAQFAEFQQGAREASLVTSSRPRWYGAHRAVNLASWLTHRFDPTMLALYIHAFILKSIHYLFKNG